LKNIRSAALGLVVALAAFTITAGTARASWIYDISAMVGGATPTAATGTIEFSTQTGSSLAGLVDFAFSGTSSEGAFSFTESDIVDISWSIDASSVLTLTALDAGPVANGSEFACLMLGAPGGQCYLAGTIIYAPLPGAQLGVTTVLEGTPVVGFNSISPLSFSLVQSGAIPAPPALAIMVLGLAGIAAARRRKRLA
jgi:hypothetical protein